MNAETFTERKNLLEEFYKERMKFKIYDIDIIQANPYINIYEHQSNIFFKTHITFTKDRFLISELYKHLKPIIYTMLTVTQLEESILMRILF